MSGKPTGVVTFDVTPSFVGGEEYPFKLTFGSKNAELLEAIRDTLEDHCFHGDCRYLNRSLLCRLPPGEPESERQLVVSADTLDHMKTLLSLLRDTVIGRSTEFNLIDDLTAARDAAEKGRK